MARKVLVAAAQLAPVFLDREATVRKACEAIARAAADGAQLIVFPESYIPGYPYWNLVNDAFALRNLTDGDRPAPRYFRRLFDAAVERSSATVDQLSAAAKKAGCVVVMGLTEREGGTLYNSQLTIDSDGCVLDCRRKLVPTFQERMCWGAGDGSSLNVHDTAVGRVGALICFEHSNPLFRYAVQAQGEQIHVANWPGATPFSDHIIEAAVRHYAFEGQCFVISVTGVLPQQFLEELGPCAEGKLFAGGGTSCILGPDGRYLARCATPGEEIVMAELDFDLITERQQVVDSAGHYARPDVVQLVLNRTRRRPLVITEDEAPLR